MNRYPLWKYVIIAVALAAGIVYTVPNMFPEVPAVQVSSSKAAVKIDNALLASIEEALKAASIEYRGVTLDPTGIKVRFADPDTQLKAKDALQAKLGTNYIVALNLLSASPQWLTAIGAKPMYLGLDLRGGVHFLLQVDMKAALDKAADRYTTDIRSLLREKKVQYSGVAREGTNVVVRFRDEAERGKARTEIEKSFPDLVLREADATGELRLAAALKPEAQKKIQDGAVQQNITILRNRVNELGVAEPIVQQQGARSRRRPAARRAGHGAGEGHPRPHGDARGPDGQRGARCARGGDRRPGAVRQRSLHRAQRRAGARPAAGGADGGPHQRCAARLRPAQQRAGRPRQPRRDRRADLQGGHARERRQADGDRARREGQGRGDHGAGHSRGDRRRTRPDQRQDDTRARRTTSRS